MQPNVTLGYGDVITIADKIGAHDEPVWREDKDYASAYDIRGAARRQGRLLRDEPLDPDGFRPLPMMYIVLGIRTDESRTDAQRTGLEACPLRLRLQSDGVWEARRPYTPVNTAQVPAAIGVLGTLAADSDILREPGPRNPALYLIPADLSLVADAAPYLADAAVF
jgi:hypothetical protein